jgi:DNA-binding HxlR family transcriptional regulator
MADCKLKRCQGRDYYCTVELTLNIIGGKWKPIILYHLGATECMRFGQLKNAMPNITQKMLTRQLRELEKDNLVHRKVYAEVPPRVEYSLTEFGRTILPVLQSLSRWGADYETRFHKRAAKDTDEHLYGTAAANVPELSSPPRER